MFTERFEREKFITFFLLYNKRRMLMKIKIEYNVKFIKSEWPKIYQFFTFILFQKIFYFFFNFFFEIFLYFSAKNAFYEKKKAFKNVICIINVITRNHFECDFRRKA